MCHNLGGKVDTAEAGEYGRAKLTLVKPDAAVFKGVPPESDAWMSHRDRVVTLPARCDRSHIRRPRHGDLTHRTRDSFETTCSTAECPYAAVECIEDGRQLFGFQFHPEVTHSQYGETILRNFIELAGLIGTWRMDNFIEQQVSRACPSAVCVRTYVGLPQIAKIQQKCSDGRKVFVLVSGGVDSTVVFSLLSKALPGRVLGLFVDTGMMRHNEGGMVKTALEETFPGANLHFVNAEEQFLTALAGETAPEKKRRIIGQQFLDVQKSKVTEFGLNPEEWLLGQVREVMFSLSACGAIAFHVAVCGTGHYLPRYHRKRGEEEREASG
eukprot:COSAG01_NODE_186_length_22652_cov_7.562630_7_plen_326_part_00